MLILSRLMLMVMLMFFRTLAYFTVTGGSNEKGGRPECDSGKKNALSVIQVNAETIIHFKCDEVYPSPFSPNQTL